MSKTATTALDTFRRMAREFPVRTGIYSFGLPAFAVLQLVNGFVNDGPLLVFAALSIIAVVCSVLLTQYQLAVYRRYQLTKKWL